MNGNGGHDLDLVEFDRARYEYCKEMFERDRERKNNLENKAQIVLSLTTLLVAAIFLNVDVLGSLRKSFAIQSLPVQLTIVSILLGLGVSLAATLYFVLRSIELQSYKSEHPKHLVTFLFAPDKPITMSQDPALFYQEAAERYAIALEINTAINDEKAKWVRYSWYSILSAGAFLIVFLALFIYMSIV